MRKEPHYFLFKVEGVRHEQILEIRMLLRSARVVGFHSYLN
jgi:hypothetical protein